MPALLPEFDTAETDASKLPDFGDALPDFGEEAPVAPSFESPLSIGEQGPVWKPEPANQWNAPPAPALVARAPWMFQAAQVEPPPSLTPEAAPGPMQGGIEALSATRATPIPEIADTIEKPPLSFQDQAERMQKSNALAAAWQDMEARYAKERSLAAPDMNQQGIDSELFPGRDPEALKEIDARHESERADLTKAAKAAGFDTPPGSEFDPLKPLADLKTYKEQWLKAFPSLGKTGSEIAEGLQQLGAAIPEFFSSPAGAATAPLMVEKLVGAGVSKLVARAWVADMLSQTPEEVQAGIEALKKGDYAAATKAFGGVVMAGVIAGTQGAAELRGLRQGGTRIFTGDMPENMRRAQVTTDRLALPPAPAEALPAPAERLALTEGTPEAPVAPQAAPIVPERPIPLPDAVAPAVAPAAVQGASVPVAPVVFDSMFGPMPMFRVTEPFAIPGLQGPAQTVGSKVTLAALQKAGMTVPESELAKASPKPTTPTPPAAEPTPPPASAPVNPPILSTAPVPFENRGPSPVANKFKRVSVTTLIEDYTRRFGEEIQSLVKSNPREPNEGLIDYRERLKALVPSLPEDIPALDKIVAGLKTNLLAVKADLATESSPRTRKLIESDMAGIKGLIANYESELGRVKSALESSPPAAAPVAEGAKPATPITPEPKPAAPGGGKGLAGEVRRRLEAGENPGGEAGGGVPIGDLIHEFGKTVWKKGMAFAEWSKRMISELGNKAKAWLKTVWTKITDLGDFDVRHSADYNRPFIPIKIRGVDGKVYDAQFNGWQDMRQFGGQLMPSIGRKIEGGGWSHAYLRPGEKMLTRLPSPEKWSKLQAAEKARAAIPTSLEIEAGAGIPIPKVITDALKKSRDTIKTLARTKGVRAVMAYTKDVAGNAATVYGQRVGNNVRGELRRAMGRGTTPNVLDENALTFVREANGDRSQLAVMRGKITASTLADPKWKAAALKAIDHAATNWGRLNPIASQYEGATHAQIVAENAAGINTLERPGYVMHAQDVQSDFGFFSDVAGEGTTGFKHARAYDTFADSIAAGVDPKSINAVVLLTQRVARGQMLINNRMWVEGLKTTVDPQTRKTVVTEPEVIPRGIGLPPDVRAPTDYVTEIAGGRPIAILKSYSGIFRALTEPSKFSESLGWNATLKVATTGKHVALMLDTFHLGRIAFWESVIKPLSFTDPKFPLPSYKRGVLTLDYSRAELQRMAAAGEINPAHLNDILAAQRDVNGLVKHGYNVAKISDMLHQEWLQQIPITGQFNKWLFNQFQRGAMAEVGSLEVGRYRRMHPSWSDAQVYREVAKDLNTRFGNLGRQGIFKSKTAQDTARLLALAPQWNEGLISSEVGAVTGAVKGIGSSIKEGRPSFGILPRAIGAMLLGQFAVNQIINYITRGKPTWENEEEGVGAKISAWVPDVVGGGPGFFLHPAGLAAEVTHLLTQKYSKKGDLREALMSFIGGRYSTLARPLATFLTRHDVFGKLIRPENIWKESAKAAVPLPIGASAAVPAIKQLVTGEKKETFPGQYQKQLMASGGVKTDQAPSPGQRIKALADNFKKSKGITDPGEFYESAYVPLRQALQRGAVKEARQAYDDLIQKDYKENQIAAAMRPWTGGNVLKNGRVTPTNPKPFSGSSKHEAEFLETLTPEQLKTAEAAYAERVRIFRVFQDMLE